MRHSLKAVANHRRGGMTLVEVLVSLVIIGSLCATALVARSRSLRQVHEAERRLEAAAAADRLLSAWAAEGRDPPMVEAGRFRTGHALIWETRRVRPMGLQGAPPLDVVRLSIYDDRSVTRTELLSVEVVVRSPAAKVVVP